MKKQRARHLAAARCIANIDPRNRGRHAVDRAAADGRDRQGAVAQCAGADHGRADRRADRPRDRAAVPHHGRPEATRSRHRLRLAPHGGDLPDLRPDLPFSATASSSANDRPRNEFRRRRPDDGRPRHRRTLSSARGQASARSGSRSSTSPTTTHQRRELHRARRRGPGRRRTGRLRAHARSLRPLFGVDRRTAGTVALEGSRSRSRNRATRSMPASAS